MPGFAFLLYLVCAHSSRQEQHKTIVVLQEGQKPPGAGAAGGDGGPQAVPGPGGASHGRPPGPELERQAAGDPAPNSTELAPGRGQALVQVEGKHKLAPLLAMATWFAGAHPWYFALAIITLLVVIVLLIFFITKMEKDGEQTSSLKDIHEFANSNIDLSEQVMDTQAAIATPASSALSHQLELQKKMLHMKMKENKIYNDHGNEAAIKQMRMHDDNMAWWDENRNDIETGKQEAASAYFEQKANWQYMGRILYYNFMGMRGKMEGYVTTLYQELSDISELTKSTKNELYQLMWIKAQNFLRVEHLYSLEPLQHTNDLWEEWMEHYHEIEASVAESRKMLTEVDQQGRAVTQYLADMDLKELDAVHEKIASDRNTDPKKAGRWQTYNEPGQGGGVSLVEGAAAQLYRDLARPALVEEADRWSGPGSDSWSFNGGKGLDFWNWFKKDKKKKAKKKPQEQAEQQPECPLPNLGDGSFAKLGIGEEELVCAKKKLLETVYTWLDDKQAVLEDQKLATLKSDIKDSIADMKQHYGPAFEETDQNSVAWQRDSQKEVETANSEALTQQELAAQLYLTQKKRMSDFTPQLNDLRERQVRELDKQDKKWHDKLEKFQTKSVGLPQETKNIFKEAEIKTADGIKRYSSYVARDVKAMRGMVESVLETMDEELEASYDQDQQIAKKHKIQLDQARRDFLQNRYAQFNEAREKWHKALEDQDYLNGQIPTMGVSFGLECACKPETPSDDVPCPRPDEEDGGCEDVPGTRVAAPLARDPALEALKNLDQKVETSMKERQDALSDVEFHENKHWTDVVVKQKQSLEAILLAVRTFFTAAYKQTKGLKSTGKEMVEKAHLLPEDMKDLFDHNADLQRALGRNRNKHSAELAKLQTGLMSALDEQYPPIKAQAEKELEAGREDAAIRLEDAGTKWHDDLAASSGEILKVGKKASKAAAKDQKAAEATEPAAEATAEDLDMRAGHASDSVAAAEAEVEKLDKTRLDDKTKLEDFAKKKAVEAEKVFQNGFDMENFADEADATRTEVIGTIDGALSRIPATPGYEQPADLANLVVEAMEAADAMKHASGKVSGDMSKIVSRLHEIVENGDLYTAEERQEILGVLNAMPRPDSAVAEGGEKDVEELRRQADHEAQTAFQTLRNQNQTILNEAEGVQENVEATGGKVQARLLGIKARMEAQEREEQKIQEESRKEVAAIASNMMEQAQEMQMRHMSEQDKCIKSYKSMSTDLTKLAQLAARVDGSSSAKAEHDAVIKTQKAAVAASERSSTELGSAISEVTADLKATKSETDSAEAQLKQAHADLKSALTNETDKTTAELKEENAYVWKLQDKLSKADKEALARSSAKIGGAVDQLEGAADTLPGLSKVIEKQDDLANKIKHHRQFLFNAAKGMASKVDGKLDSLGAEQQIELAAGASLTHAEGMVLPDRTGELAIHAPSVSGMGAEYGSTIDATLTRELGALNSETAKEEQHLSSALASVGTSIAEAGSAVSAGAKHMMEREAEESDKATTIVKNAKAASATAGSIYMQLHGHADDVRQKLDSTGKVVADMELAKGMDDDPAFWKVADELSTVARELKSVGMASGKHSLVETEPAVAKLAKQEAELQSWSQQLAANEQHLLGPRGATQLEGAGGLKALQRMLASEAAGKQ